MNNDIINLKYRVESFEIPRGIRDFCSRENNPTMPKIDTEKVGRNMDVGEYGRTGIWIVDRSANRERSSNYGF